MRRRWIGTGLVLAVLAGGTVAAVRLAQPDPALRTFGVGAFPYAVAVSAAGRAFVVNRTSEWTGLSADGGSVSVVDLRNGTVVRRVPVGEDPRAIAVDEVGVREPDVQPRRVQRRRAGDGAAKARKVGVQILDRP